MKDFEKKIKDRFQNAQSTEGIDANELWESISSEIGNSSTESSKAIKNKFNLKRFWPLLALLLFSSFGIYFYSTSTKQQKEELKQELALDTNTDSNTPVNSTKATKQKDSNTPVNPTKTTKQKDSNLNSYSNKNSSTAQSDDSRSISESTAKSPIVISQGNSTASVSSGSSSIALTKANNSPYTSETSETSEQIAKTEIASGKASSTPSSEKDDFKSTNITIAEPKAESDQLAKEVLSSNDKKTDKVVSHQSIDQKTFELFERLNSKALPSFLSQREKKQFHFEQIENVLDRKNAHFSLGVFGGTHLLKYRFVADDASRDQLSNDLNNAYKTQFGNQFGLELNFHLNPKLYLSAGVEYQQSITQFDLVQNWDTLTIHPNVSTGEWIAAKATRTVRHHNRLTVLSVPLSLGYQRELGRFGVGANAGLALNFAQKQSGKTLNGRSLISEYPNSENPVVPISDFFLSYHLRPYVYFKSSAKISWQLRTQFSYQNYGQSDYYGLKHGALFSGLSFGVVFKP